MSKAETFVLDLGWTYRTVAIMVDGKTIVAMAESYYIDFDAVAAGLRVGLTEKQANEVFYTPTFHAQLQETLELMDEGDVMSKKDVLVRLKKEAVGAERSSDRVNALKAISTLSGFDAPTKVEHDIPHPVVNITIATLTPNQANGRNDRITIAPSAGNRALNGS